MHYAIQYRLLFEFLSSHIFHEGEYLIFAETVTPSHHVSIHGALIIQNARSPTPDITPVSENSLPFSISVEDIHRQHCRIVEPTRGQHRWERDLVPEANIDHREGKMQLLDVVVDVLLLIQLSARIASNATAIHLHDLVSP